MTFVVTESCISCKYTDCVDVCPVDAFREGPNFLAIDPAECIDCAVCVPECPVNAIFAEEDVPADQQDFIALNAELAPMWKTITRTKAALPDADKWASVACIALWEIGNSEMFNGAEWKDQWRSAAALTVFFNLSS